MKCIVTGSSGFIGSHLVEYLIGQGVCVYGLDQQPYTVLSNLDGDFHFIQCDMLNREGLNEAVANIKPELVFHLASQSLPNVSWTDPETTFRVNVFGTLYLLDAIKNARLDPTVEVFCSSGEYAINQEGTPIREDYRLDPSSPYALSKIAQDQLCGLYWKAYQMHILRVRPFYIIGPRKMGDVCSDWSRGIVSIERGIANELVVGNLEPVRDFLDVQDAVAAFRLISERGTPGEVYNVCSGTGYKINQVLEQLKKYSLVPFEVRQNKDRLRPIDEPVKIGDNHKLIALGWKPQIPLDQSLKKILDYWRDQDKSPVSI